MPADKTIEWAFPVKGWHTVAPRAKQPPMTSPDLLNVMPFDRTGRARGGSRPGLSKALAGYLGDGASPMQYLGQVAIALPPDTLLKSYTFNAGGDVALPADWAAYTRDATYPLSGADTSNATKIVQATGGYGSAVAEAIINGSTVVLCTAYNTALTVVPSKHKIKADVILWVGGINPSGTNGEGTDDIDLFDRLDLSGHTPGRVYMSAEARYTTTVDVFITISEVDGTGAINVLASQTVSFVSAAVDTFDCSIELDVDGNNYKAYLQGNLACSAISTASATNQGVGFGFGYDLFGTPSRATGVKNFQVIATGSGTGRQVNVVAAAAGNVYEGEISTPVTKTSTSLARASGVVTAVVTGHGVIVNQLITIAASTATTNTFNGSFIVVSVTDANTFTYAQAGANEAALTAGTMTSDTMYLCVNGVGAVTPGVLVSVAYADGKAYIVDGTHTLQLDLLTRTITNFTATVGTFPPKCTLAAMWHGRLGLMSPTDNRQDWFVSRIGVYTDWDIAAGDAAQAIAGNGSAVFGKIGDPLTAVLSFTDDVAIFFGDHNIWQITGDPAAGGSIDSISNLIGGLDSECFTQDPTGAIYFVGTAGFYSMAPSTPPSPLSSGVVNDFFRSIDRSTNDILVRWDPDRWGAWIFITPIATGAAIHLWYDHRAQAFFRIQYPDTVAPTAAVLYDGDGPLDRKMLLGGRDGHLYQVDETVDADNGTAISSYVVLGPERPTEDMYNEANVFAMEADLAEKDGSHVNSLTWQLNVATDEANVVISPMTSTTGSFVDAYNRQRRTRLRMRGAVLAMKVSNTTLNQRMSFERFAITWGKGAPIRTYGATPTRAITTMARASGLVTVNLVAHGLALGQLFTIAASTATTNSFNGTFVVSLVVDADHFKYVQAGANETALTFGTLATDQRGTP